MLSYIEKITLSNLTHMMSMDNLVDIGIETPRIFNFYSLEKEFTKLICMNP